MLLYPGKKSYSGKNVVDSFFVRAERWNERPLVWYRKDEVLTSVSWDSLKDRILDCASYLVSIGVKKGDRVAVFSSNCWEWWVADLAILSVGGVSVPVYATNSAEETRYVIEHSGSKVCFVGDDEQQEKIFSVKRKLPTLKKNIILHGAEKKGSVLFKKALILGNKSKKIREVEKRIKAIKGPDCASIVYTSGTTGNPKGVVITHDNFISNVIQLTDVFGDYLGVDDCFLSFLPLSHALERTASFYTAIYLNCQVAFAENFKTISRDLLEVQPTVIVSVPRLFEKIHSGVLATIATMNPVKRAVLKWALRAGRENIPNICANRAPQGWLAKKLSFAEKKVFSVLRKEIGFSRNRVVFTGGGPLSHSDCEFFLSIGINVYEGYGLTEASPATNVNRVGKIKIGTVGPALLKTELKLSDEGEVLIKGPQVMKGYYREARATREAFDKKGFLKTGDIGLLDEDGYLSITGRIKDIIVTAGGKNISPQNIESKMMKSKYVENVAIVGDRRKYLSALIIPNFTELGRWAKSRGLDSADKDSLISNKEVNAFFEKELEDQLKHVARVEQIRRFTLINDAWGIESGELTPTLKVKRRVIEKKYADVINAMYSE
jgi:long-chain acyl-CoA synthetase